MKDCFGPLDQFKPEHSIETGDFKHGYCSIGLLNILNPIPLTTQPPNLRWIGSHFANESRDTSSAPTGRLVPPCYIKNNGIKPVTYPQCFADLHRIGNVTITTSSGTVLHLGIHTISLVVMSVPMVWHRWHQRSWIPFQIPREFLVPCYNGHKAYFL